MPDLTTSVYNLYYDAWFCDFANIVNRLFNTEIDKYRNMKPQFEMLSYEIKGKRVKLSQICDVLSVNGVFAVLDRCWDADQYSYIVRQFKKHNIYIDDKFDNDKAMKIIRDFIGK